MIPYLSQNKIANFENGIYVAQITKNGPAYKSDLKEGDIITQIDGNTLNTMNDLRQYIYTNNPNDTVVIEITRGKIKKQIRTILGRK